MNRHGRIMGIPLMWVHTIWRGGNPEKVLEKIGFGAWGRAWVPKESFVLLFRSPMLINAIEIALEAQKETYETGAMRLRDYYEGEGYVLLGCPYRGCCFLESFAEKLTIQGKDFIKNPKIRRINGLSVLEFEIRRKG